MDCNLNYSLKIKIAYFKVLYISLIYFINQVAIKTCFTSIIVVKFAIIVIKNFTVIIMEFIMIIIVIRVTFMIIIIIVNCKINLNLFTYFKIIFKVNLIYKIDF